MIRVSGRLMLLGNTRSNNPPMNALMKSDHTKHATPTRNMPKISPAIKRLSPMSWSSKYGMYSD